MRRVGNFSGIGDRVAIFSCLARVLVRVYSSSTPLEERNNRERALVTTLGRGSGEMVGRSRNDVTGRNQHSLVVIGLCRADTVILHVFGNASETAYRCCVYLVSSAAGSRLVYSKTKVAPLAAQTLPQLEQEAACLAARQVKFVMQASS